MSEDQTQVAHILAGMLGASTVEGFFTVMPFEEMTEEQMAYHLRHLHGVPASSVMGRSQLTAMHERGFEPKVAHVHHEIVRNR